MGDLREKHTCNTESPLPVIVGPTATAKSALAVRLALEIGGEVISADSVQVYRRFDVGSGKPTAAELNAVPHHLIDIRDPLEPLEAHIWAQLAVDKIAEIRSRHAVPIICGGTFLWVRALLYGLADAPPGDAAIRSRHQTISETRGRQCLHHALVRVDPKSAARLHANDFIRVSRALEVFELTGRMLSTIQAEHGFRQRRFHARLFGVKWEKEEYEKRLRRRIITMLDNGWCSEVRTLMDEGYQGARAMDAVGYRQVRKAVENAASVKAIDKGILAEDIIRVTRIFARRQRTWLRDEEITYLPASELDGLQGPINPSLFQ